MLRKRVTSGVLALWLVLLTGVVVSGCAGRSIVRFQSQTTRDLAVRLVFGDSTQTWFVPAGSGGVVADLQDPRAVRIEIIDPNTCAVLLRGDLPPESVSVNAYETTSGRRDSLALSIARKQNIRGPLAFEEFWDCP